MVLVGLLDYNLGYNIDLSIFYLLPALFATWFISPRFGLMIAILCNFEWLIEDYFYFDVLAFDLVKIWNMIISLSFFSITIYLTDYIHVLLRREQKASRTDPLTGIDNLRSFLEKGELELKRSLRYERSFSVAYFDLDNFKWVNDKFGHDVGDELLIIVTNYISENIRDVDIFTRIGGDEFILILSENSYNDALKFIERIQKNLNELMEKRSWPVTFSIGLISYAIPNKAFKDIIKEADHMMYLAKEKGKNQIVSKQF